MPVFFNKYYPIRNVVFVIGESLLIFSSLLFISWLFKEQTVSDNNVILLVPQVLVVTIVFQLCLYFFDVYELRDDRPLLVMAIKITQAFGSGCIVLAALYYFIPQTVIESRTFWVGCLVIYIVITLWRVTYNYIFKHKLFVQSVAIMGTGEFARDIARELEGRLDTPYRMVAFVGKDTPAYNPNQVPVYKSLNDLHLSLSDRFVDRIVVALDDPRGGMPIDLLLNYKLKGVTIENGITFYERLAGKILVNKVKPSWIIFSKGFTIGRLQAFLKRSADILVSLILLILTSPVMILTIAIIKLESPGPVLYLQQRVGKGRRLFKVMKFRSMVQDAEKNGAVWAVANDARVTRFGKFIRKTRIDELPQLINVLKGEMSVVGPRPERPVFVERLKQIIPFYDIRHDIRPGVTGWAQVCYPYGASEEDALRKLEYDLYYMKNVSFALDMLIIFRTIKTVVFAKGGR
ncbi:glycosyl transferase [Desulfofustis limnaeus]|uniref:Glycosyl transferase n=2 Tax=Desulfofustis limnaeus TaxID=2740163 RepID=A0ABN6M406_9BACT|nr:glycosyl transferase [Desulfofustis limnaeus]